MQVAYGFDVRQDAGADHEGQHMDRYQESGADCERNQHAGRYGGVLVELDFDHGNHCEAR